MGLDANDCKKASKYEQDIQKVADTMFQLKEKAPLIGEYSSVKTPGKFMEEQGDESEIDDGSQEDEPETDSNPEWSSDKHTIVVLSTLIQLTHINSIHLYY